MIFAVLAVMFMASPMANAQDVKVDKMPTFQNGGLQDFAIWAMRSRLDNAEIVWRAIDKHI